jgi:hypothetical protein
MNTRHGGAVATALVLLSGFASGQTGSGPAIGAVRVSGRVVDPQRAPIANAAVSLKADVGCNAALTHTRDDGTFALPALPQTECRLGVEAMGFKTAVKPIVIGTGKEIDAGDIVMQVGGGDPLRDPVSAPAELVEVPVAVHGLAGTSATLSTGELSALPQQTVKTIDHGVPVTFQGVLLMDALSGVALPVGEAFHPTAASYYLTVEAKDGYRAVFAWVEIDPAFTDAKVYLVTKRDGKPLPDKDGPIQLVAPGDKRGARWARQVAALKIRRAD